MPAPNTWETVESILPRGRKIVLDLGCGEQLEIDHIWEFSGYEVHRCDIRDFKNSHILQYAIKPKISL